MLELYIRTDRPASTAAGLEAPMDHSIELNRPVFTERDGREIVGMYAVDGDRLHVAWDRHTRSAPLLGSNPEVLAHVLLDALLDEVWREARAG
jgi:hypothetical protein